MGVWKVYSKFIFGSTCPIFGTFTNSGEIIPGPELCEACSYEPDEEN
jgi:hypothetical protein